MNEKNSISYDLNNSSLNSNDTKNNRIKFEKPEQSANKINKEKKKKKNKKKKNMKKNVKKNKKKKKY